MRTTEQFVKMLVWDNNLVCLTNRGRLFMSHPGGWAEIAHADFEGVTEDKPILLQAKGLDAKSGQERTP